MSDTSQGPGWWQASDGKWYAPEIHPDYVRPQPPITSSIDTTIDEYHRYPVTTKIFPLAFLLCFSRQM